MNEEMQVEACLQRFAKQTAVLSRMAQKEIHSISGFGAARCVFALADQLVVQALTHCSEDGSDSQVLIPVPREIPPRDALTLLRSHAAHIANCKALGVPVHFASHSNAIAKDLKSHNDFADENQLHKTAGTIRHEMKRHVPPGRSNSHDLHGKGATVFLDNLVAILELFRLIRHLKKSTRGLANICHPKMISQVAQVLKRGAPGNLRLRLALRIRLAF